MQHLISIDDLSREEIVRLLSKVGKSSSLKGKLIATCFFEPSTRTRLSFEAAAKRLGAEVIGFSDAKTTADAKGESLSDAIRVVSSYVDVVVIRHPRKGAAHEAACAASCPVINAGDGDGEHPTQTLLDLYTIWQCQGRLSDLNVVMCGDLLHGRTVHSLVKALAHFDAHISYVAPHSLEIPGQEHSKLEDVLPSADILYMTRQQKERTEKESEYIRITLENLKNVKPNLRILHPLPRVDEIAVEVDETPYAYYFEQAKNGVAVREVILEELCLSPCLL